MRMRRIAAAGLLSFDDFSLELDPQITTLVGPNGSGKTNVLRLVDVVANVLQLQALHDPEAQAVLETYRAARHGGGSTRPVKVAMDLTLDDDSEVELITSFMRSAIFAGLVGMSGDANVEVAHWVMSEVVAERLTPLARGTLIVGHRGTEETQWDAVFRFSVDGRAYDWLLDGSSQSGFILDADERVASRTRSESISQRLSGSTATTTPKPPQDAFSLRALLPRDETSVHCQAEPRGTPLSEPHRSLIDNVRRLTDTNVQGRSYTFGIVLLSILRRRIIRLSDARLVPVARGLVPPNIATPTEDTDIPRFLVDLKNGAWGERQRYFRVCEIFSRLTHGRKLDIRLRHTAQGSATSAARGVPIVRVSVDSQDGDEFEIPIDFAGSGAWEALTLAATLGQPQGTVVILDEPAISLHPTLQRHLLSYIDQSEAQFLLVTHSPYLVPLFGTPRANLLIRIAREGLATRAWRVPSKQLREVASKLVAMATTEFRSPSASCFGGSG